MKNQVSLEFCKKCPSWWRWYDESDHSQGGYCKYDNNRINCCWSEDEVERERK